MKPFNLWRWCAMAILSVSTLSFAQFPPYTGQYSMPYKMNLNQMQANLGFSGDPIRGIQQAAAALQYGTGSQLNFFFVGYTSFTGCADIAGTGVNLITSTTPEAPGDTDGGILLTERRAADLLHCPSGEWVISVPKSKAAWKVLATQSTDTYGTTPPSGHQSEIAGSVLNGFLRISGASGSNPSTCLSSVNVTDETLMRSRNAFCNAEIRQIAQQGTFRATITGVKSLSQTPGGWTNAGLFTPVLGGVGGFDGQLGYVAPTYDRGGVIYVEPPGVGSPGQVKFVDNTPPSGGTGLYATGIYTYRRPSFAYDPTRKTWWIFAHDPAYEDRIKMYTSPDRITWTDRGTLAVRDDRGYGTQIYPVSTRMNISVSYSPGIDRMVYAYVLYGSGAYGDGFPLIEDYARANAGTLNVGWVNPVNPAVPDTTQPQGGVENIRRPAFHATPPPMGHSTNHDTSVYASVPPTIVCGILNCPPPQGQMWTNYSAADCIGIFSDIDPETPEQRNLASFEFSKWNRVPGNSGDFAYDLANNLWLIFSQGARRDSVRPTLGNTPTGWVATTGVPVVGGASDFPASAASSAIPGAAQGVSTGVMAIAVTGVDGNVYVNTMQDNRGGTTAHICKGNPGPLLSFGPPNWSGWSGVAQSKTSPSLRWRQGAVPNYPWSLQSQWTLFVGN